LELGSIPFHAQKAADSAPDDGCQPALLKHETSEWWGNKKVAKALETLSERAQRIAAMDAAEFDATLDALAEESEKLPVLPSEATNRAGILPRP
jgi:hypothetical protein